MLGTSLRSDIHTSAAMNYTNRRLKTNNDDNSLDLLIAPAEQTARVMARPNYLSNLTPRTDPFVNTGAIRGSAPRDLGKTAIQTSAISPLESSTSHLEQPPQPIVHVPMEIYGENQNLNQYSTKEFYNSQKKEKNLISSPSNKTSVVEMQTMNSMSGTKPQRLALEPIDEPFEQAPLQSANFSKLGDMIDYTTEQQPKKQMSDRPDLSFADPKDLLPKNSMSNSFGDPRNPNQYIYDRNITTRLKSRFLGEKDRIRGDLYIAPNKFGWFDVPTNPGTDLNAGFVGINYPSFESNIQLQDTEVQRSHPSLTAAQAEQIKFNNPFAGQSYMRSP